MKFHSSSWFIWFVVCIIFFFHLEFFKYKNMSKKFEYKVFFKKQYLNYGETQVKYLVITN